MTIEKVTQNPKAYLNLLLLADEQETMIDRYLEKGTMYILQDGGIRSECVVTDEGGGILEIRNIATLPAFQRMGYGRALVDFLGQRYKGEYGVLQVGTSPGNIPFYEKCGFVLSHSVANFFAENYDHPIYENGLLLRDMIYLQKQI